MSLFTIIGDFQDKHGFAKVTDVLAVKIGLELDALVTEDPQYTATVSKNSVESGAQISDHVAINPLTLNVDAVISNTPVSFLKIVTGATFSNPAKSAYKYLVDLFQTATPFSFVGGLQVYHNMVITSLSAPRTAATANALRFQCKMEQVNIVASQELELSKIKNDKPTKARSAPMANAGYQVTQAQGIQRTAKVADNSYTQQLIAKSKASVSSLALQ